MKNIKKYILGFALMTTAFTFLSCEDKLEIIPNNALVPETAFRTVDDLQNGLNAAYSRYGNNTITLNSIFTDNTKVGFDNGGQQLSLHRLVMDPNTGIASTIWINRYTMINETTRVIDAAASGSIDIDGRQSELNNILGQCYALRAFAHFELFQYYTPDYLDPNGLSVPAVDINVTTQTLPRNTVSEVLTLINDDLTVAQGLLDQSATNNKYVTTDFLKALKARIGLFTGDYTMALNNANDLINSYDLADRNQYVSMYNDNDNTEVIFKAARTIADARPGNIWHFFGGGPFMEMSNSLFNELDPADVRYNVLLNVFESDPANNVHKINKYPGTAVEFLADVKVFRVSEMYLIKAEVEARNSDFIASRNTLKELRDARYGSNTALESYANLSDALDVILKERRLELAYEGHRYLDLKRLNRNLERIDLDCGNLDNACQIVNTDPRFTLPIPAAEINANPNMVQNPGY
ncbi:RagB/SusD family nutrient uptake outer membrane protein [Tenacibaculum geojense]|uniref:RagB/SusD family nutrient uptake outer membrane protein n=1 Tax=Tenacibaculum geojense TaxID=915352 RepID=A0ABW3JRJ6_9FLAO